MFVIYFGFSVIKVRKTAKIGKGYNQVPYLTHDTTWESNKNTVNITNKSQEVKLVSKWPLYYFQPYFAAISVTIATVKVKLKLYFYTRIPILF